MLFLMFQAVKQATKQQPYKLKEENPNLMVENY